FVDASGRLQLTQNSMDAVSDRDFAVEFCAAAALLAVHLSRLAAGGVFSGRVIGNLVALLTRLKGLPMTYNRDLQEDKERLFDTADTVRATTRLMAAMLNNTKVNKPVCACAASDPSLLATDLADYLVKKGMPFRQAHHVVGEVVALAEKTGKTRNQLTLAELQTIDKT